MSSMSSDPGDQVNINSDYDRDRGSAMRWLLPLLALAVVVALLWSMFGNRDATYPSTTGTGTTISTPVGGTSTTGGTTGGTSGAGVTGTGGTTSQTGGSAVGPGTSGTAPGTTGGTSSGTSPGTTTKP
jgi:hypothetical protein